MILRNEPTVGKDFLMQPSLSKELVLKIYKEVRWVRFLKRTHFGRGFRGVRVTPRPFSCSCIGQEMFMQSTGTAQKQGNKGTTGGIYIDPAWSVANLG